LSVRALLAALGAVLCLLLALEGCSEPGSVTVNGTVIPASELSLETERRLAVARKDDPSELKGERGQKVRAETARQVATELIRAELVRQQARKLGVVLPADEVNRRLAAEKARAGEKQFTRDLEAQGMTVEQ